MNRRERAERFAALGDEHRLLMVDALGSGDLTPGELAELCALPTNLAAHHLRILADAGIVVRSRSEGDGRRRYVTLSDDAFDLLIEPPQPPVGNVAFVCTQNSARSQFAAARFTQLTGRPAQSAGSQPAASVHPHAVDAARPYGLDLSGRTPRGYSELGAVDVVVSVCDRALESGLPPHRRHLHWSVPDPAPGDPAAFADAFARIDRRLRRTLG